ncbi:MAG: ABC transporter ATP-binding protein [Lachnospiraceae bacterium]|nr:ABC transporter ATP-binding protein [Lachnospiraceae bacterium]
MIKVEKLTKIYNKGQKTEFTALKDVDLVINDGDFISVTGTSGAGKSTLLYVLSGIDSYEGGSVLIDGVELGKLNDASSSKLRNEKMGFVMQDFALMEDFTVVENVMLPLRFAKKKSKIKELALEAIERVGITELANKTVNQLSGGQKQRTAIARAIVTRPSIIFADEPTGALDTKTSSEIMDLFEKLNKEGQTVIIVTHDSEVAARCKRHIEISDGKITPNKYL